MRISDWSSDVCSSDLIRPTDCGKDRAGSGDHSRLYDLIWKRALASQMASARMERTTVELADGTGRTALRATGQVVLFPGYLAPYEEGSDDKGFVGGSGQQDDAADEDSKRSEEHKSELQSLMRISYAVFCLKKNIYRLTHSSS